MCIHKFACLTVVSIIGLVDASSHAQYPSMGMHLESLEFYGEGCSSRRSVRTQFTWEEHPYDSGKRICQLEVYFSDFTVENSPPGYNSLNKHCEIRVNVTHGRGQGNGESTHWELLEVEYKGSVRTRGSVEGQLVGYYSLNGISQGSDRFAYSGQRDFADQRSGYEGPTSPEKHAELVFQIDAGLVGVHRQLFSNEISVDYARFEWVGEWHGM